MGLMDMVRKSAEKGSRKFKKSFRTSFESGIKPRSSQEQHSSSFDFEPQLIGGSVPATTTKPGQQAPQRMSDSRELSDSSYSESTVLPDRRSKSSQQLQQPTTSTDAPLYRNSLDNAVPASIPEHSDTDMAQTEDSLATCSPDAVPVSQPATQTTVSSVSSARSSFALERQSLEANRASLKKFGGNLRLSVSNNDLNLPGDEDSLCTIYGIPPMLRERYLKLSALPLNTPVPIQTLAMLWGCQDTSAAEGTAYLMQTRQIIQMATVNNGDTWCLVAPTHLRPLQNACKSTLVAYHNTLLEGYFASNPDVDHYADMPDDGYIVNNIGWHLVGAGQLDQLKDLLLNPAWLEMKLHAYGVGSVVADFRRYLMHDNNNDIKLILEAFQMSVASCQKCPAVSMLACQMAGRLMAVQQSPFLKEWCEFQHRMAEEGLEESIVMEAKPMWTRSPSLEQAGGLQRMTLRGHSAGIIQVLLAPSGVEIVTASRDGTMRVWDMDIGDCVLILEGHEGAITSMAMSAAGDFLLSGSNDMTARLWELERGKCVRILQDHLQEVSGVALDPLGRFAITVSHDGTGRVWELAGGTCVHLLKGHGRTQVDTGVIHAVALSPDSHTCVTCGDDFTGRVWDLAKGVCIKVLEGHTGWVVAVAITPDACRAVTASHDGTAIVWDLWSGAKEHVLKGHKGRVNKIKVSGDGQRIVTVSDDQSARVYNIKTGEMVAELSGHSSWLNDVAITHGGTMCVTAAADKRGKQWDLTRGECVRKLEGHNGEVHSVVLTSKGRFAVTASEDSTARVWDLNAPKVAFVDSHEGRVHAVKVTPDGATAVTAGDDFDVRVWDVAPGKCRHILKGHQSGVRFLDLTTNGTRAISATGDRNVRVWDLESGECVGNLPSQQGSRLKGFQSSGDGKYAVMTLWDSSVTVIDLSSGNVKATLQKRGLDKPLSHKGGINDAYIMADGAHALTVSKDATARVWDLVEDGHVVHILTGHSDAVGAAAVSEDGTMCATVSYDGTARVWSLASGECMQQLDNESPAKRILLSPDASKALTVGDDKGQLWNLPTGQLLDVLTGHSEDITGFAFSADNLFCATCSSDCTVALWNAENGLHEGFFMADGSLSCCAFATEHTETGPQHTLVVGSDSGRVHFLAWYM